MNRSIAALLLLLSSLFAPAIAVAADGCTVLLCLAGNWSAIPACVPPVRQVLRDLARGRGFPTCAMSGGPGNSASMSWANSSTCPPMYSLYNADSGNWEGCTYAGTISVSVSGASWADVFWSFGGSTSTRYTSAAKAQLGAFIDPTFDADQAAWDAAHPPAPPPTCYGDC